MRDTYHSDLDAITDELAQMTSLVGSAMQWATRALMEADLRLAESVIDGDAAVDALAQEIDERCFSLAALQQPVATDLRIVMSGMRIASSLERMGDLAVHVAKQARLRYPRQVLPTEVQPTFAQMGTLAEVITKKTGAVITTKDVALGPDIERHDNEVDRLHRELFSIVLSPSWSHGVETAIDVTLLSRYYERFADHAVTIARRVAFVVTGEPYASITLSQED